MSFGFRAAGRFEDRTGADVLAGAAPYYDVYETKDHRYVAVAAIEPQFFQLLLEKLGLDVARWGKAGYPALDAQVRSIEWPALKRELARVFRTRSRDEWSAAFAGADACVTPVLSLAEAAAHPHNLSRVAHVEVDGVLQNAPTPRFSRTPCAPPRVSRPLSDDADAVLGKWGVASTLIDAARRDGALR